MPTDPPPVLLTSVPANEAALAEELFPEAARTGQRLSAALAGDHPDTRILSVASSDPVSPEVLDHLARLEAVVTRSDGYDHLPLAWLAEHEVPAYHLAGYATRAVAEHALMLITALLRRVPEAIATTLGHEPRWDRGHLVGRGLTEVTVGVLGVGRIGGAVTEHLAGMGARVRGYDIAPRDEMREVDGFAYVDSLQALLQASDVLTVHVPLTDETRGMVGKAALATLPEGACLVNTARGAVLDQAAVAEALSAGRLAGYAADVLPEEPDPPDLSRFQDNHRVLLTPHLAAYDTATLRARYEQTADIVQALLSGGHQRVAALRVA